MEDAAEALEMAFSVFAFVLALSVAMITLSQSKTVADIVMQKNDRTYIETYMEAATSKDEMSRGRIVGVETVIPNLYRYFKEKYTIEMKTGPELSNIEQLFDLDIERRYARHNVAPGDYYEYNEINKGIQYKILYPSGVHWVGANTNTDAKARVDAYVSGKSQKILDEGNNNAIILKYNGMDFNQNYYQLFDEDYSGVRQSIKEDLLKKEPDGTYFRDGTYFIVERGQTKIHLMF